MAYSTDSSRTSAGIADFILYVAIVVTFVMLLFPPFTSFNGTEYAFVLTGPEWSRGMGTLGEDLGLTARIHWIALLVQIAALWAIALGATWLFGSDSPAARRRSGFLLFVLPAVIAAVHGADSDPPHPASSSTSAQELVR